MNNGYCAMEKQETIKVFEEIKVYKYKKIIENILYDGLHSSLKAVMERKNNEKIRT